MSLACGGRGPCCHIGYSHRHCEHCDVVIPTYHVHYPYWSSPYYGTFGVSYYGNTGGLLNGLQQQQIQQYGASTIVDAASHTHEETN
jgi:hypothetical protein